MILSLLLLISKVTATPMVLYQSTDVLYVEARTTAEFSCGSSEPLEDGTMISWYRRTGGNLSLVKYCAMDSDKNKYVCNNGRYRATLQIHNTETNDSGVYLCTYNYHNAFTITGNGTTLIVGDSSPSKISIHLLILLQHDLPQNHLLLACVAHEVGHTAHIAWNMSGTFHKGKMTSIQRPEGTWTFMNIISLSKDSFDTGNSVSCEVWFNSSTAVVVHWQVPDDLYEYSPSKCQSFLRTLVIIGILLLLTLTILLTRTLNE
ncbi:uncharacterized protein LOC122922022 isoform X2 [Bufo gargarizans]|uniref:uncharacterized protein LOC122922022 isoform X2 n=1 Tax=Bufo gargarizans TaxID=30331 RepID=UPI001CF1978D|nr:uncharacterized protein LOC122922022 isoform X2 [Bufo gargarizans]